jgi:transcription initiation factor TFIID TATA-box-binding protein
MLIVQSRYPLGSRFGLIGDKNLNSKSSADIEPTTDKKDLDISIVNVVASVTMNQTFNLVDILKVVPNSEYNPKRFPGLVYRSKRPKASTLIFSTGKMVCTGTKSEKLAISAVNRVVKELKAYGIIITGKPIITIQNMVASGNLHGSIDLELAADILENVMYEPEQFPGLIYRMQEPKTVLLLFASGKLVCTGAKSEAMVYESVSNVVEVLKDFDLFLNME